jgi:hypothetical protein
MTGLRLRRDPAPASCGGAEGASVPGSSDSTGTSMSPLVPAAPISFVPVPFIRLGTGAVTGAVGGPDGSPDHPARVVLGAR